MSGTVTFSDAGGLVSTALQVKSTGGTVLVDTSLGQPSLALTQFTLVAGGKVDELLGGSFNPYHLALLFDPAGISGGGDVSLVPSATILHPGGQLTEFSNYASTTSADLTEGTLTPESPNPTPEPASLSLMGIGAAALFGYGRRQRRKVAARAGAQAG